MTEPNDMTFAGNEIANLSVSPTEFDVLLKAGLVRPLGEGSFSLNTEMSASGKPQMFSAAINNEDSSVSLTGDSEGVQTLEAIIGELRYAQTSDKQGLLSRNLDYTGESGYGAGYGENRFGGKEMTFKTPAFSASRYKDDFVTEYTLQNDRGFIGHTRDESGYRQTRAGINFPGKRETDWQAEVNASVDNFGNRQANVVARKRF